MYLVAAFLFALNGVLSKNALNAGLDPMHLTELRNAGAMVVLVAYVALRHRERFRVTRRELPFLVLYGVIAFTLVQFLYFLTISRLPVGIGTLLGFLAPVVVALWIRFARRQDVSGRIWLAIVLTLVGLSLVAQVWQGLTLDPLGVAAGLCLALALAAYWLLGESGQEHRDAVSLTMWGFIFATLTWSVSCPAPSPRSCSCSGPCAGSARSGPASSARPSRCGLRSSHWSYSARRSRPLRR